MVGTMSSLIQTVGYFFTGVALAVGIGVTAFAVLVVFYMLQIFMDLKKAKDSTDDSPTDGPDGTIRPTEPHRGDGPKENPPS